MKKTLIAALVAITSVAAFAGDRSYYNQFGQFQGRSSSDGGTTSFYNQFGQFQGRAQWNGSGFNYYNQFGQFQGRSSGH